MAALPSTFDSKAVKGESLLVCRSSDHNCKMSHTHNSGSPKADSAAAAAPAKKRGSEPNVPEEGFYSAAAVRRALCKRPRGSEYETCELLLLLLSNPSRVMKLIAYELRT